tara:strand:- start:8921 stop:10192 length:1272 start_codon:yes stop_codon:yes gene_type:complete
MHPTPNGSCQLCCVGGVMGNLNDSTPEEIWNNENYKRIRRNMLNDVLNPECKTCTEQERFNSESLRLNSNSRWYNPQLPENKDSINECKELVKNTKEDGHLNEFHIKYMDFRVSNLCNFKCRMCHHELSSEWFEDAVELSETSESQPDTKVIQIKKLTDNFDTLIDKMLPHIEHIYWAGGEPMLTDEHWVTMNKILEEGHEKKISLLYNTNGSRLTYKDQHIADIVKHFPQVSFMLSVDGSYERGEYIRKGLDYQVLKNNIKYMQKHVPHLKLGIQFSLTVFNAWHMPDFYFECVNELKIGPEEFTINYCHAPEHYRCSVLPPSVKLEVLRKWNEFHTYCVQNDLHRLAEQIAGAKKLLKEDYSALLPKFLTYTEKLDRMRKDNFFKTFPEYAALRETHYTKWENIRFDIHKLDHLIPTIKET